MRPTSLRRLESGCDGELVLPFGIALLPHRHFNEHVEIMISYDDDPFDPENLKGLFLRYEEEDEALEASELHRIEACDRPHRLDPTGLAEYWQSSSKRDREIFIQVAALTDKDFWELRQTIRNANFWDLFLYAIENDPWCISLLDRRVN